LAKEEFWDKYHGTQTKDWFLNHANSTTYLKEHTEIANTERTEKLVIMDLGCGTSTLAAMLLYNYKSKKAYVITKPLEAQSMVIDSSLPKTIVGVCIYKINIKVICGTPPQNTMRFIRTIIMKWLRQHTKFHFMIFCKNIILMPNFLKGILNKLYLRG
jgi:hypothetical protein